MTDQQRTDTIGALGNPLAKTPALDRLVRGGCTFNRAFTPSPVCAPARAALASGLLPHQTGLTDNDFASSASQPRSMMQNLSDAGYQTCGVGKMHFVPDSQTLWGFQSRDRSEEGTSDPNTDDYVRFLHDNGYQHVEDTLGVRSEMYYIPQPSQLPERLHHTRWVADRSIDFLERRDKNRPFFLWSSWIKPHPPFESPTPWNKLFRGWEMPEPFHCPNESELLTYWNHVQNRYKYHDRGEDLHLIAQMRAAYAACVSYIDFHIARLLEKIDLNNTLILFTADHGEMLGDYGCFGKRTMLDQSVKIPLIAHWPGKLPAGSHCDTPASLIDISATCVKAADAAPLSGSDGVDLITLAKGEHADRMVTSQFQQDGVGLYMGADSHGKYIYSQADDREFYFDRQNQPETESTPATAAAKKLKKRLMDKLRSEGHTAPFDGNEWRKYPRRTVPTDPKYGLLAQDTKGLQKRIDALGEYSRPVTVPDKISYRLLQPHQNKP